MKNSQYLRQIALYLQENKPEKRKCLNRQQIDSYVENVIIKQHYSHSTFYKSLKEEGFFGSSKELGQFIEEHLLSQMVNTLTNRKQSESSSQSSKEVNLFIILKSLKGSISADLIKSVSDELMNIGSQNSIYYIEAIHAQVVYSAYTNKHIKQAAIYTAEIEKKLSLISNKILVNLYAMFIGAVYNNSSFDKHKELIKELINNSNITDDDYTSAVHYYYSNQLIYSWMEEDTQALEDVSSKAIEVLSKRKDTKNRSLLYFYTNLGLSKIYNNDPESAIKILNDCKQYSERDSATWLQTLIAQVVANIHAKYYQKGYNYYFNAISSMGKRNLTENIREDWIIIKAFIAILYKAGLITPKDNDKSIRSFRLQKFMNEVDNYVKSKNIHNASILILHTSHLILDKVYAKAYDRIMALEKYCVRYLRKSNQSYRMNLFIKMLIVIPKCNFNKIACLRHAKKNYDLLLKTNIRDVHQPIITEVIPYGQLWEILVNSLDSKLNRNYLTRQ